MEITSVILLVLLSIVLTAIATFWGTSKKLNALAGEDLAEAEAESFKRGRSAATSEIEARFATAFLKFQQACFSDIRTHRALPKGKHEALLFHSHKGKNYAFVRIVTTEFVPGTTDQPYPEFAVILIDSPRPIPLGTKWIVLNDDPLHFEP